MNEIEQMPQGDKGHDEVQIIDDHHEGHSLKQEIGEDLHYIERTIINPKTAAFLLLAVAVLGFMSATLIASETPPIINDASLEYTMVTGYVEAEDGEALVGALVLIEEVGLSTTTNSDGYYLIRSVPTGEQQLVVSQNGYRTIYRQVTVVGDRPRTYNFVMDPGTGSVHQDFTDPPAPASYTGLNLALATFLILTSTLSLMGAYYCWFRKSFRRALLGAAAAPVTFGFMLGSVLGVIALIFVLLSKNDFFPIEPLYPKGKLIKRITGRSIGGQAQQPPPPAMPPPQQAYQQGQYPPPPQYNNERPPGERY